jgi:AraC family transcriptional regulator
MLNTKSVTSNLLKPIELNQRMKKTLMLSSWQMGWNGISIEQYQYPTTPGEREVELPGISDHWFNLPLGHPVGLSQKRDDRLCRLTVERGDSLFIPAGQPTYWSCQGDEIYGQSLHIYLTPESIAQAAEAADIDLDRIDLSNCFSKQDGQLQQIAMLLLAELRSGGIMGRLYVESLTQVLVIHLLRHYATVMQTITSEHGSLTRSQLQHAIEYIHTYLDRDLSLVEIAEVINISPTYFASLFKRATGNSPHQYVIQQRVERAKEMISKTDLSIADIALEVGFSSHSHLTQQFKRLTGVTPKQIR